MFLFYLYNNSKHIDKMVTIDDEGNKVNCWMEYRFDTTTNEVVEVKHATILTPSYNRPTIKDENMAKMYSIIEYADLYNFLKEHLFSFYNDANFVAFFEAMERHTHKNVNDYLYYDMLEKFVRRIKM